MDKKIKKIILTLSVVVIFLVIISLYKTPVKSEIPYTQNLLNNTQTLKPPEPIQKQSLHNIATFEIGNNRYESEIEKEISVYDFMTKLAKEGKINFKEKNYIGMGKFIEELNGIKGDGDRFWIYYVNGKKAKIGVSNYKINPGDVVSWRYEKDIN